MYQQVFLLYDAAMGKLHLIVSWLDRAVRSHPKSLPSSHVNCGRHVSCTLHIMQWYRNLVLIHCPLLWNMYRTNSQLESSTGHGNFLKGSAVITLPHLFTAVNCTKCTRSCKKVVADSQSIFLNGTRNNVDLKPQCSNRVTLHPHCNAAKTRLAPISPDHACEVEISFCHCDRASQHVKKLEKEPMYHYLCFPKPKHMWQVCA